MLDPFTKKRIVEVIKRTHFDDSKIYIELAEEFGRRMGMAERAGLTKEMAFESCKEHFKITGQAMIELSRSVTCDMFGPKVEEVSKC